MLLEMTKIIEHSLWFLSSRDGASTEHDDARYDAAAHDGSVRYATVYTDDAAANDATEHDATTDDATANVPGGGGCCCCDCCSHTASYGAAEAHFPRLQFGHN